MQRGHPLTISAVSDHDALPTSHARSPGGMTVQASSTGISQTPGDLIALAFKEGELLRDAAVPVGETQ